MISVGLDNIVIQQVPRIAARVHLEHSQSQAVSCVHLVKQDLIVIRAVLGVAQNVVRVGTRIQQAPPHVNNVT